MLSGIWHGEVFIALKIFFARWNFNMGFVQSTLSRKPWYPKRLGKEKREIVCADAFVLSNHHLLKVMFLLGLLDLGFPTPLDRGVLENRC
jgi:hypothetical protein